MVNYHYENPTKHISLIYKVDLILIDNFTWYSWNITELVLKKPITHSKVIIFLLE